MGGGGGGREMGREGRGGDGIRMAGVEGVRSEDSTANITSGLQEKGSSLGSAILNLSLSKQIYLDLTTVSSLSISITRLREEEATDNRSSPVP